MTEADAYRCKCCGAAKDYPGDLCDGCRDGRVNAWGSKLPAKFRRRVASAWEWERYGAVQRGG